MENNDYETFIHKSRYARWLEDEGRRETWEETVDRVCQFWINKINTSDMSEEDKQNLLEIIG